MRRNWGAKRAPADGLTSLGWSLHSHLEADDGRSLILVQVMETPVISMPSPHGIGDDLDLDFDVDDDEAFSSFVRLLGQRAVACSSQNLVDGPQISSPEAPASNRPTLERCIRSDWLTIGKSAP